MQENEGKPPLTGLLYNGLLRCEKSLTEISWAGKGTNTPDVFTKWKLTFKNVDHHSLSVATFQCGYFDLFSFELCLCSSSFLEMILELLDRLAN